MAGNDSKSDWKAAAHDLNNLLTIILNSAELLKKKSADPDLLKIISNVNSSAKLAAELLEESFISPDAKRKYKPVNINSIISETALSIGQKYSSDITIALSLCENIGLVKARYSGLYRIFMNLIINAAESITGKGLIEISTAMITGEEGKPFARIIIRDNGSGIPEKFRDKIFEKGFSTKQKSGLSGIGLSAVKELAEGYEGKIAFKSKVNSGTEFQIIFPASSESESVQERKKSVLIAEDEDILRELLADLLESYEYTAEKCADGNEVLSRIETGQSFDLLILDKKMPGMDGIACIKSLREKNYGIPVILASGSPGTENNEPAKELGIDRIVNKPYNFEELLQIIRELIG